MTPPPRPPDFSQYGRPRRVEGGIRATSTRGDIGESWWSKRFIAVLESFRVGGRLARGRAYARAGQVLELTIAPGWARSRVQGSRPDPYSVRIGLSTYDDATWARIEQSLAAQALFAARLLAGEMPPQIEEVFADAGAPLFPTRFADLEMSCTCPDMQVPCKHIAATFYLLAEAFDADPFEILHWRGRDRVTLLANLSALRKPAPRRAKRARRRRDTPPPVPAGIGTAAALRDLASPPLEEMVGRFWVAPVPLPAPPPALVTDVDLVLRALPTPDATIGGPALTDALRTLYATFRPDTPPAHR